MTRDPASDQSHRVRDRPSPEGTAPPADAADRTAAGESTSRGRSTGDDAPVWRRNPCRSIPSHGGEETIEVRIFHRENRVAAGVVARYARFVIADAWPEYDLDISVRHRSVGDDVDADAFFGLVHDEAFGTVAKDCNLLLADHVDSQGGGSIATASTGGQFGSRGVAALAGDCLRQYGVGDDAYVYLCTCLHEIGHCLGLSHRDGRDDGEVVTVDGRSFATIMKSRYAGTYNRLIAFSETAKARSPEVQPCR